MEEDLVPFMGGVAFRFERVDIKTEEGWENVKRMGLDGWDLITVSGGYAYLRDINLMMDDAVDLVSLPTCGTCPRYKSTSKKMGRCLDRGFTIGPKHEACETHPNHPAKRG